ncbi:MAG: hypothetical protein M1817_002972 [Caeruleum heppii]|nr:MAG: hypothetical protein M1817_002972 [Caeruleum heppii]
MDPATGESFDSPQPTERSAIDHVITTAPLKWGTPIERARVLLRAAQLLRHRNDELAKIETRDTGKPFSETSTVDVVTGADVLEYYAHLVGGGGLNGEMIRLREDAWVYSTKEPLGLCVGIGAWNYPLQIALWKSAPCLAAGNSMIYKPSEFTQLHAQALSDIYLEAGVPSNVFNVVYGDGKVGAYLTSHPAIAKVSFTGQVSTGMKVAASAAGDLKYVTMELGGKSPLIILPDTDVEHAVDGAMMANFFSTGQVCTNGTRVFVQSDMVSAFEKRLLEKMKYVRSGDPMETATNFGPLISRLHYDKVIQYIKHGCDVDKAHLIYGGTKKPVMPTKLRDGFWVKPTIFSNCTDDMRIVQEEIFGPVMTILEYSTVDEVVARANATPLGLAAGVFTKDLNLAYKVVSQLEAGITWINTWGESPAEMSVGGWKKSGLGVENGKKGLEGWVQNKSTLVDMGGTVTTVFSETVDRAS